MAAGISSEKVDLLIYGPDKPIVQKGFSDQFVLHPFEAQADLERLSPAVAERIRGEQVLHHIPIARIPRRTDEQACIYTVFGKRCGAVDAAAKILVFGEIDAGNGPQP